ncbi:thioesterase II family protein [Nonomuraea recticatena]|uniref:Alpha/beta fold hydrolase n=1 Tax=Nonomuraea recticatena TaxID=46178 RepID=A0ABP6FRZ5_9ACTN
MNVSQDVVWDLGPGPGRRVNLLVLPHAGGSAHAYLDWADLLPAGFGLLIGQYPGRGARYAEPLPESVDDLVDPIVAHLPPTADELIVLGHSMGGLMAFEIVRRLEELGRPVLGLVASACRAPHLPNPSPVHPETLSDDELVAVLRTRGGTPEEVLDHPQLRSMVMGTVRADFAIDDTYRFTGPTRVLRCPVAAVGGDSDPVVPLGDLARWAEASCSKVTTHVLPGGHFYFQDDPSALLSIAVMAGRVQGEETR